jgi:hypothetical protein
MLDPPRGSIEYWKLGGYFRLQPVFAIYVQCVLNAVGLATDVEVERGKFIIARRGSVGSPSPSAAGFVGRTARPIRNKTSRAKVILDGARP